MAEILDQQNTGSIISSRDTWQWDALAQAFQAGQSGTLSKIKLYLNKTGTPANLVVEIQGISTEKPDGNILASEEINVASVPAIAQEFEISFTVPASVVFGTDYAIVFYAKGYGGDGSNNYVISTTADDYANGKPSYTNNGDLQTNWHLDEPPVVGSDYYFKTYVTIVGPATEIEDINNDFRIAGTIAIEDINNDFRIGGVSVDDINNDFRMTGLITIEDIINDCRTRLTQIDDVNNKIYTVALGLDDIINDYRFLRRGLYDINNKISFVNRTINDVNNDIRTHKLELNNVNNDFRMLTSNQIPDPTFPNAGVQSLGKSVIIVKINNVDKTSLLDLESLSWTERLNYSSSANFTLGIPYDSGQCPSEKQSVEILFDNRRKFYGYITSIVKSDSPDSINIEAQDEYWNINQTEVDFKVGRKLSGETDTYYDTIADALTTMSFNVGIGNFVPVTMSLTGSKADVISQLVQESGNYGWFITPLGVKTLWRANEGNIITLEKQAIGANIGLYQVIEHNIENISENIVNKYRVVMGDDVVPGYNNDFRFSWLNYSYNLYSPEWINYNKNRGLRPVWLPSSGKIAKSYRKYVSNIGWFDRRKQKDSEAGETYVNIPGIGSFKVTVPPGYLAGYPLILEGTAIRSINDSQIISLVGVEWDYDYLSDNGKVDYSYGSWTHRGGIYPEGRRERTFEVSLGSYSQTIKKDLILSGLNVQYGTNYLVYEGNDYQSESEESDLDSNLDKIYYTTKEAGASLTTKSFKIPSWNDIEYATDYAYYQLSKNCDIKTKGSIKITLDSADIYQLNLGKRIKISGIADTPLNITSITYDISSWLVTINVESFRAYNRTISLPVHEREKE